jgi:two-component system chemotaxis response regulator CheY
VQRKDYEGMDINKAKILVCDDSILARKQLKHIISIFGNPSIVEANDGVEAVSLFKEEMPDMVFLDLVMPRLDGMEALKQILAIDEAAKVVIVSSVGTKDTLLEAVKLGAKEFIQKPFSEFQIINALTKNLA